MRTPVLLHLCKHADEDDGLDFRCDCDRWVSLLDADVLRARGTFTHKKIRKSDGTTVADLRQLVKCGRDPRLEHARMISHKDIERAYVSSARTSGPAAKYARKRIEAFARCLSAKRRNI
jgi:hypothetical protein